MLHRKGLIVLYVYIYAYLLQTAFLYNNNSYVNKQKIIA